MLMAERLVICGGLPATSPGKKDIIALDVNAPDHAANRVKLKLSDISARMVENVPPVLIDLLEIAAYVYCADQVTGRGGDTLPDMGRDWRRRFRFRVPVRRPDLWGHLEVLDLLVETLSFLSEDDYAFDFVQHPDPAPAGLQPYLDFEGAADAGFVPDDIILFSGGLDSLQAPWRACSEMAAKWRSSAISHPRWSCRSSRSSSRRCVSRQRHCSSSPYR
jgi:hypothetical protein